MGVAEGKDPLWPGTNQGQVVALWALEGAISEPEREEGHLCHEAHGLYHFSFTDVPPVPRTMPHTQKAHNT